MFMSFIIVVVITSIVIVLLLNFIASRVELGVKMTDRISVVLFKTAMVPNVRRAEGEKSMHNSPLRNTDEFIDFPLNHADNDVQLLENKIISLLSEE